MALRWAEIYERLMLVLHIMNAPDERRLTHRTLYHWEMDTIVSSTDRHCVVSLVERVTGCMHSA